MDSLSRTAKLEAAILNAAYMVRHHSRGARMRAGPLKDARTKAIQRMGEVVRDAFMEAAVEAVEYEALLIAIVRGLGPDEPPF